MSTFHRGRKSHSAAVLLPLQDNKQLTTHEVVSE